MDLRNVIRANIYHKAVRKLGKRHGLFLHRNDIYMLVLIRYLGPGVKPSHLNSFAKKAGRGLKWRVMSRSIGRVVNFGWVDKKQVTERNVVYTINLFGENTLKQLERLLRVERLDR